MSEQRLIDANALKEDMKSRLSACNDWIEKAKDKETKIRASAVKAYISEVIMTIDNAPTVAERPKGEFTRKELESWLYQIAFNNTDNELSKDCEEIISRLDGFERFVVDMRGDNNGKS